jgi:hypothetical protein
MSDALIPDAEAILGDYLRSHPNVEAFNARIVPATPDETGAPWVKVTQLDATDVGGSKNEHLIEWFGTFDCYAGKDAGEADGQEVASALTRTVRAALKRLEDVDPVGAVTSRVRIVSCPRLPDPDLGGMERDQLTLTLRMRSA